MRIMSVVDETNLGILSRNFYLIHFTIVELGQIVTQNSEWLKPRSRIQKRFILVSPALELLDILIVRRFACDEVFTVLLLYEDIAKL